MSRRALATGPAARAAEREPARRPLLYLNARFFAVPFLYALLGVAPLARGLFFEPDLLPAQVAVAALFLLAAADRWLRERSQPGTAVAPRFGSEPMDWAATALVLLYAASFWVAADRRAALAGGLRYASYAMVYVAAGYLGDERGARRRMLRASWLGGLPVAALAVGSALQLRWLSFPGGYVGGRFLSTFQYPNALAAYLMLLLLLGLGLWSTERSRLWRAVYAAGSASFVMVFLGTGSRGAWAIFPAALVALVAGAEARERWRLFYRVVSTLTVGALASTRFVPAVEAGMRARSAAILAGAVAAALVLEEGGRWVRKLVERRLERGELGTSTVTTLRWLGALYGLAVAGSIAAYAQGALPSALAGFLPQGAVSRVQSISLSDESLLTRILASGDAWRLALEHPWLGLGAGGWNALYHTVQSALYWTTEVHNQFFQTLVETGFPGLLAYLALWGGAAWAVVRVARRLRPWSPRPGERTGGRAQRESREVRRLREEAGSWNLIWAVAVALLALAAHSAMDFDLSIPALALLIWGLFGWLRGLAAETAGAAIRFAPRWPAALGALGVLACAALLAYPSVRLDLAGQVGAQAAQAMAGKRYAEAVAGFERASRLDPWTASFDADLAQILAAATASARERDRLGDAARLAVAARRAALEAERVQPYNLPVRNELIQVYTFLDDPAAAARQAESLVRLVPLDAQAYQTAAAVLLESSLSAMAAGDRSMGRELATRLGRLAPLWQAAARQADRRLNPAVRPRPEPAVPPELVLAQGQSAYLLGEWQEADRLFHGLLQASADGRSVVGRPGVSTLVAGQAAIWWAASLTWQGIRGAGADPATAEEAAGFGARHPLVETLLRSAAGRLPGTEAAYMSAVSVHVGEGAVWGR
ncbi:MAG: O-antigen ligase family protein [Clostridia bacterium]|nr:O-antigen ligase family protein [Clostridia bacterium]